MEKQPKKRTINFFFCIVSFITGLFLSTCGIEEYYYLDQVPQTNIIVTLNTSATIILPALLSPYALNYSIYYRIYISDSNETAEINTPSLRTSISANLASDFNAIYPNTDPTSNTMGISADTLFKNRSYFMLALEGIDINNVLTKIGGVIDISFPTETGPSGFPTMSLNGGVPSNLYRSKDLIRPLPANYRYFQNTSELSNFQNANSNINADVSIRSGLTGFAYVSMYIAAEGIDPTKFTRIYSKPTHIGIFKLPNYF